MYPCTLLTAVNDRTTRHVGNAVLVLIEKSSMEADSYGYQESL